IALGTLQMGNRSNEEDSVRILDRYFAAGGSFLDTADMYEWYAFKGSRGGQSEEVIGRWMRGRRDEVFLATKGGGNPQYSEDLWNADGTPNWQVALRTFPDAGRK